MPNELLETYQTCVFRALGSFRIAQKGFRTAYFCYLSLFSELTKLINTNKALKLSLNTLLYVLKKKNNPLVVISVCNSLLVLKVSELASASKRADLLATT